MISSLVNLSRLLSLAPADWRTADRASPRMAGEWDFEHQFQHFQGSECAHLLRRGEAVLQHMHINPENP